MKYEAFNGIRGFDESEEFMELEKCLNKSIWIEIYIICFGFFGL